MIPNHIDVISMGCSKNLIDSERLLRSEEHTSELQSPR